MVEELASSASNIGDDLGDLRRAIRSAGFGARDDVVLVSGPVALPEPPGVQVIHVVSAEDMFEVVLSLFDGCRSAIMTAAVCDYRPTRRLDHKLRKQNRVRTIHLQPTQDICAHLGRIKGDRVLIGFAMEDQDHRARAEEKLRRKRCDAIVLNGLGNVGGDSAEIEVFRPDSGWDDQISGSKAELASVVVDLIEKLVRND